MSTAHTGTHRGGSRKQEALSIKTGKPLHWLLADPGSGSQACHLTAKQVMYFKAWKLGSQSKREQYQQAQKGSHPSLQYMSGSEGMVI